LGLTVVPKGAGFAAALLHTQEEIQQCHLTIIAVKLKKRKRWIVDMR
jgi:hypothetical protein